MLKTEKIGRTLLLCCLFVLTAVCLNACAASETPYESAEQKTQEAVYLDSGQQFVSDTGLTVSIDELSYSNDGNLSILIKGTVKNTSDKDISLKDAMSVSVIQNGLVCEGIPRKEVGLTKGIGFQDSISAGAEETLMDVVCTIEAMSPVEVKIIFENGCTAIWNL